MAEMPDVATLTVISKDWGNAIRSRTVQRYSSVANRTTLHPSPAEGDLSYLTDSNTVWVYDGAAWMLIGAPGGTSPTGSIQMFGGAAAPTGWLLCQGQAISRTTFAALFSVLGETYGAGNGTSTFNVPNLQQRFPLGKATSGTGATLGSTGGNIDHSHAGPNHNHTVDPPATNTGLAVDAVSGGRDFASGGFSHNHSLNIAEFNTSLGGNGPTGSGNPPFTVVQFIVKT